MKLLHVLKSEPDDTVKALMTAFSEGNDVRHFEMYKGDVDYDQLIELVFENDKTICWW